MRSRSPTHALRSSPVAASASESATQLEGSRGSAAKCLVSHDDPSGRHGQSLSVLRAQIVRVRMIVGSERSQRGHLVAVIKRQRCHGFTSTSDLRAESSVHLCQRRAHVGSRPDAARDTIDFDHGSPCRKQCRRPSARCAARTPRASRTQRSASTTVAPTRRAH